MSDDRTTKYADAIRREAATFEHDFPAGRGEVVGVPDAAFVTARLADTELAALKQECRDRECTEQDVRARLADAEAKLAQVKSALLMGGQSAAIRAQAAIAIVWDGTP